MTSQIRLPRHHKIMFVVVVVVVLIGLSSSFFVSAKGLEK
jgi:hypothetical protein